MSESKCKSVEVLFFFARVNTYSPSLSLIFLFIRLAFSWSFVNILSIWVCMSLVTTVVLVVCEMWLRNMKIFLSSCPVICTWQGVIMNSNASAETIKHNGCTLKEIKFPGQETVMSEEKAKFDCLPFSLSYMFSLLFSLSPSFACSLSSVLSLDYVVMYIFVDVCVSVCVCLFLCIFPLCISFRMWVIAYVYVNVQVPKILVSSLVKGCAVTAACSCDSGATLYQLCVFASCPCLVASLISSVCHLSLYLSRKTPIQNGIVSPLYICCDMKLLAACAGECRIRLFPITDFQLLTDVLMLDD